MKICERCGKRIGFLECDVEKMHYKCYLEKEEEARDEELENEVEITDNVEVLKNDIHSKEKSGNEEARDEELENEVEITDNVEVLKNDIRSKEKLENEEVSYNSGNFWTEFLRVVVSILLVIGIILGIVAGFMTGGRAGLGAATLIILYVLISIAVLMLFIEISENIYKMRKNSDEILEIIKKK